jgi:hypothetical protein
MPLPFMHALKLIMISPSGLEPYTPAERWLLAVHAQQISHIGLSLVVLPFSTKKKAPTKSQGLGGFVL